MKAYYDPEVAFEQVGEMHSGLVTDAASFEARATRARLQSETAFAEANIRRFWFKPYDLRWAYIERRANLWNRVRPELLDNSWQGNEFILTRRHAPKAPDGATFFYSRHVSDQHVLHTDAYFIPFRVSNARSAVSGGGQQELIAPGDNKVIANLAPKARAYLRALGSDNPDSDAETARLVWMHALVIGYSPAYLSENRDGIRQDWPRIPLPDSKEVLLASAELGNRIAALVDTETPAEAAQAQYLQSIAGFKLAGEGPLEESKHFAVTAGWGHAGKGGITMPGHGRTAERDFTAEERRSMAEAAVTILGERTLDIYLNEAAYWANVPARVWEYTIGGYQVMKKWLSYREEKLLGRPLTKDEVRYVQDMARRIAAILLLEPALDANYLRVKQVPYGW